ncbi:hypothetical protein M2650_03460 [Luteimonas sp. SX5]|uniref:Uncharacterized protein n=1 Tax=Luteimonas galliterrae TaxID=2940486 RepID=A0ABT0MFQ7_9GAMM|nr:hypothetical protein [Luteimonas galliterrae]MCL1633701.1 hypothetical protein [Luteimonas galliterrae]
MTALLFACPRLQLADRDLDIPSSNGQRLPTPQALELDLDILAKSPSIRKDFRSCSMSNFPRKNRAIWMLECSQLSDPMEYLEASVQARADKGDGVIIRLNRLSSGGIS